MTHRVTIALRLALLLALGCFAAYLIVGRVGGRAIQCDQCRQPIGPRRPYMVVKVIRAVNDGGLIDEFPIATYTHCEACWERNPQKEP